MTHPPIQVLGYSEATMMLDMTGGLGYSAVIAIHGHGGFAVEAKGVPNRLVLQFDDVPAPHAGDPVRAARKHMQVPEAEKNGRPLTPPTVEHARQIIRFAHSLRAATGTVLCHCLGGVSRSPAAALLCMATWTGPGHEDRCMAHLLDIRPQAVPHPDLVAFGDHLLGREGRLLDTLARTRQD